MSGAKLKYIQFPLGGYEVGSSGGLSITWLVVFVLPHQAFKYTEPVTSFQLERYQRLAMIRKFRYQKVTYI